MESNLSVYVYSSGYDFAEYNRDVFGVEWAPKTLLIGNPSTVMTDRLIEIIKSDPDFSVVGVATNTQALWKQMQDLKPDCILLDDEMSGSGCEFLGRFGAHSRWKFVLLASAPEVRTRALRLGAADVIEKGRGWVIKEVKATHGAVIIQTLRRVLGIQSAADRAAEVAMCATAALLHALNASPIGVLFFDVGGGLRFANNASRCLLSGRVRESGAHCLNDIFDGINSVIAVEVREVIASSVARHDLKIEYATDAGGWVPFAVSVLPTPGNQGHSSGATVLLKDESIERTLEEILRQTGSATVTEAAIRGEGVFAEPAILFSDIRRFTSLSESMPPEALLKLLNRYLSYMADTILRRDGHIDKYIGDAIMALFGVPQNLKCNAESAVCACIEMLEALEFLNDESGRLGQPLLEIGLGVATGPVIAGNVGPLNRRNFTVIGDPVNLASRIEGLTKPYGARILIDGNTFAALPDKYPGRRIDVVQVKGQNKPTTLYEILYQLPTGGDTERWLDLYGNGLRLYEAGQFSKGASELEKVVQLMPSDKAAAILLDRCRKLMASPPPDWQGVWRMDSKEG